MYCTASRKPTLETCKADYFAHTQISDDVMYILFADLDVFSEAT
jgi:hypothetical protein